MSRSRVYKTEAVVLKQTPLGEADRILTLFAPDIGKVRAVGKGVRRVKSRLGGHLELLNLVDVSVYSGRNLDVIQEAQATRTFRGFKEDLPRLSKALYIAELVESVTAEWSASDALYDLLVLSLDWLERQEHPDLLIRHFEVQFLEHAGYKPELYLCVECRSRLEPDDHMFSCANGGVLCPTCRVRSGEILLPIALNTMKVLRFLQQRDRYDDVVGLRTSAQQMTQIERLTRTYVRFLLEKELKSVEFMDRVTSG